MKDGQMFAMVELD